MKRKRRHLSGIQQKYVPKWPYCMVVYFIHSGCWIIKTTVDKAVIAEIIGLMLSELKLNL